MKVLEREGVDKMFTWLRWRRDSPEVDQVDQVDQAATCLASSHLAPAFNIVVFVLSKINQFINATRRYRSHVHKSKMLESLSP